MDIKKEPVFEEGVILRHYKGGRYVVLGSVTHSETQEELLLYKSISDQKKWVRPVKMFQEMVPFNGGIVKRFQEIEVIEE